MMKLYIDNYIDSSLYYDDMPSKIDTKFNQDVNVFNRAIPYNEIVELKEVFKNSNTRKKTL